MSGTVGSLFTGIRGLDLGLEAAGYRTAWACESDEACRRIIERTAPGIPIIPDVREIDAGLPPVDILVGGFPCPDFSVAGKRLMFEGERAQLWFEFARAVRVLRPRHVVVENVPGLLAALGVVLADLAQSGYVGRWFCLRAADVGAPHRRERVFILAPDAERMAGATPGERDGGPGASGEPRPRGDAREAIDRVAGRDRRGGAAVADTAGRGRESRSRAGSEVLCGRGRQPDTAGSGPESDGREQTTWGEAAADPASLGRDGRTAGEVSDAEPREAAERPEGDADVGDGGRVEWGAYEPAIRRWELLLGRPAPRPTDDRGRLNPAFVEWMLGFPDGWTEGEKRTARLRMLGNAVQVQCAEVVGRLLVEEAT